MTTTTMETGPPNYDNERHTTRVQPHEQLLMGWVAGGTTIMMAEATTMTAGEWNGW
jgi:hypothetical protein